MIKNLIGFVFLLLLFFTKSVYAIGVSPYIVDISVDKGVEGVKTVKLFNLLGLIPRSSASAFQK